MRKLFFVIFSLCVLLLNAASKPDLKLIGITPEQGSEISNFNFALNFDLSDVYAQYGEDPSFGIRVFGNEDFQSWIALYHGDGNGTLLATIYTEMVNGKHPDFQTGSRVNFSFPGIPLIDGQQYTVKISTQFSVQKQGENTNYSSGLNYFSNPPLEYTFIAKSSNSEFGFKGWNFDSGITGEALPALTMEFSKPIGINNEAKIPLYIDNKVCKVGTLYLDSSNPNLALIYFGNITLRKGRNYEIVIPSGVIWDSEDPTQSITEMKYTNITGTKEDYFSIENCSVIYSENGVPKGLEFSFESVDPAISDIGGYADTDHHIEDSKGTFISRFKGRDGEWPTYTYYFATPSYIDPNTKYYFTCAEGDWIPEYFGKLDSSFVSKPFTFEFTSHDIKVISGLDPIEFQTIGLPEHNHRETGLESGYTTNYADVFEIACHEYIYDGTTYRGVQLRREENALSSYGELYEVTDNGERLIKKFKLGTDKRGTNGLYLYPVVVCYVKEKLLKGRTYKLVIPENTVTVNCDAKGYIKSPRYEFLLNGDSPNELKLLNCNIADNAKLSEIGSVIWEFEGSVSVAPNSTAFIGDATGGNSTKLSAELSSSGTSSFIKADFSNQRTGSPFQLSAGKKYNLSVNDGFIHYPSDRELCYPEISIPVYGVAKDETTAEMVNVTLVVRDEEGDGLHAVSFKAVKGQPISMSVDPGENWDASVNHNGIDLTADDKVFNTEPLDGDARIVTKLSYTKEMTVDHTTGIASIEGTPIKVLVENSQIICDGVSPSDEIAVYSVSGMKIRQIIPQEGHDRVTIKAEPGNVYVVVVNGYGTKVRL